MTQPAPSPSTVFDLSPEEKLRLVQDLWDDLAAHTEDVPLPQWHLDEVNRRIVEHKANPSPVITSWEDVVRQVRGDDAG